MVDNIYIKLLKIRKKLKDIGIKKTGKNQTMKYFELSDILPPITDLCEEYKMITMINFEKESAFLVMINAENTAEQITFTSPVETANLKHCHPVQNMGAAQTYLRRYLYMNAFEIVENDMLDGTLDLGNNNKKNNNNDNNNNNNNKNDAKERKEINTIKKEIGDNLITMFGNDAVSDKLEELTSFTNNQGKEIKGKRSLKDMSDKQTYAVHGKVKKLMEELKDNKEA